MIRYFRAHLSVYNEICSTFDAAYGYPNYSTGTLRTLPLPTPEITDDQNRVYIAVSSEFCDYDLPRQLLPSLLESGQVEELTVNEYQQQIVPVYLIMDSDLQ